MASNGWYDADGNWHDPEDTNDPPPGRVDDPNAPGGYTLPAPGPTPPGATPPPPTTTTTTDPPGTPPPSSTIGPFTDTFHAPSQLGMPDLPEFHAPKYTPPPAFSYADYEAAPSFSYADWKEPSADEALNNPGYQFRTQQGEDALQRWAAARGTLNDSGTAHALIDYGQNAATQEYDNVWNRDWTAYQGGRSNALETFNTNEGNRFKNYTTNRGNAADTYKTNYATQFVDPYNFQYRAATDEFAPKMTGYLTSTAWNQHANDTSYMNAWNQFLNSQDFWKWNTLNAENLAQA